MVEQAPVPPSASSDAENGCFFSFATGIIPSALPPTLHVALVGPDTNVIFEGFRHYPGTQVLLVHTRADAACARKVRQAFGEAGVLARLHEASDGPYVGVLQAINGVIHESRLAYENIVLNTSSGTPAAGCAALTAAYLQEIGRAHV